MLCRSNGRVSTDVLVVLTPDIDAREHTVEDAAGWLAQIATDSCSTKDKYAVVGACTRRFADLGQSKPHVVMVCHQIGEPSFYANSKFSEGLVLEESCEPKATLSPDRIIDAINDCPFPGSISISGISQQFAAELWNEIVSCERHFLDGHGQGISVHPMYLFNSEQGVFSVREISSTFGW